MAAATFSKREAPFIASESNATNNNIMYPKVTRARANLRDVVDRPICLDVHLREITFALTPHTHDVD